MTSLAVTVAATVTAPPAFSVSVSAAEPIVYAAAAAVSKARVFSVMLPSVRLVFALALLKVAMSPVPGILPPSQFSVFAQSASAPPVQVSLVARPAGLSASSASAIEPQQISGVRRRPVWRVRGWVWADGKRLGFIWGGARRTHSKRSHAKPPLWRLQLTQRG